MSTESSVNSVRRSEAKKSFFSSDHSVSAITLMLFLLLAAALSIGYVIWDGYKNQIMDNQKEQLLLTSHTLANNMEISLDEYVRNLDFLYSRMKNSGSFDNASDFYREYLSPDKGMETDILLISSDETKSIGGLKISNQQEVTRISDSQTIWLAVDAEGRHLFIFRQSGSEEGDLCLAVDADACYEKWISGIKIGTSGYIMVKNSSGIILMHPQQSQWGIHVISGRKERYPDLDLDSLENMVETQNQGGEGVSEYYSYWWMEEPLARVRKISGYAAASLGEDFWVISSVVDYDDFSAPIEKGFTRIAILFTATFIAAVFLLLFVNRLLIDRRRSRQEIATLRALNERLEEVHRGEERIAHQQRLQIIGTMTGGIAHEFNNLLTPIMGYSELLMMELPEDSEAYENAMEIYDASEKAKDVVRQISTLSRRNVETVFKKQDSLILLRRSCKMMRSICPANVHLEEDFAVLDHSEILCNSTQISQVLLNLFINAIHAIHVKELAQQKQNNPLLEKRTGSASSDAGNTPADPPVDGQIVIRARIVSRTLLEKSLLANKQNIPKEWENYLHIRVQDNGCGMNAEVLRQIFTPFFTTKKGGEGTGLGLALAEQIVMSHRGYIFAESTPGTGSVFTVYLPLVNPENEDAEQRMTPLPAMHIVIADDNAKILDMLSKNLAKFKMSTSVCRTRSRLKKILEEKHVDVLLLDETLEDDTGIDFCKSISGRYPSMLKIIMADYLTDALIDAKQRGIIDGYLLKPVSHIDALEEIRLCGRPSRDSSH